MRIAVAVLALVACGPRDREGVAASGSGSDDPGSAAASGSPLPSQEPATPPPPPGVPSADMVPQVVGPLRPFDAVKPHMKRADVQAALAAAGARTAAKPADMRYFPEDTLLYETPIPNTIAYASYSDGRLYAIMLIPRSADDLATPVLARWGPGTVKSDDFLEEHTWPPSATGWSARLRVPGKDDTIVMFGPELVLSAAATPTADAIVATDGLFVELADLVGRPLDAAMTALGPGLRRETSDDDDTAPERVPTRQGFATLQTSWSTSGWNLVLHTDVKERITSVELDGPAEADEGRVALFDALRAAFGTPQPVVSAAGRVEIRFTSKRGVVHVRELEAGRWEITISKR